MLRNIFEVIENLKNFVFKVLDYFKKIWRIELQEEESKIYGNCIIYFINRDLLVDVFISRKI